jgi:hypothetical protein
LKNDWACVIIICRAKRTQISWLEMGKSHFLTFDNRGKKTKRTLSMDVNANYNAHRSKVTQRDQKSQRDEKSKVKKMQDRDTSLRYMYVGKCKKTNSSSNSYEGSLIPCPQGKPSSAPPPHQQQRPSPEPARPRQWGDRSPGRASLQRRCCGRWSRWR